MSVAKIEQDIQLLEEEIEKINLTIADPIERNEYKKELQRKIKKLNRTKNSLEQLQKEQQELESLKHEISTVNEKPKETVVKEVPTAGDRLESTQDDNSLSNSIKDDWTSVKKSDDDWEECSDRSTELTRDLEEAARVYTNVNSSKISRNYLSKREIWISTLLAFLGFIFPYIYTRRWKPFCILITVIVCVMFISAEEEILSLAPWISVIDNGIAISKSKSKPKQKLS